MAKYKYTALKNNEKVIEGEIEASNAREARAKIREQGFLPTKVYTEEYYEASVNITKPIVNVKHLSLREKISFTSELEVLLSAGIPILEALQTVENNSPDKKLVEISSNLRNTILSGMTFSQSLNSLYGDVFGAVYTALIKTGEEAGELEVTLERMLVLLRKQEALRDKIIHASIYPSVLIVMMLGLVILFSKFIFPTFAEVIITNSGDLPCFAKTIINTTNFIASYWWAVLGGFCAAGFGIARMFKNIKIKSAWDEFVLKIPVVSEFIRYINLSNFMTVLHISYEAGVPIVAGLELSNKTVGNYTIKKNVFNSISLVRNGKPLSAAFRTVIPDAFMSMIAAGEKSGTLGKMFHDCAEVIDKKVDMALEAMAKLFEPTVIVIMGGVVLLFAIAFYQMYMGVLGSLF